MFLGLEIGSWADWISGIGTLLTVLTSSIIYFNQHREKFDITNMSGVNADIPQQQLMTMRLENIGYRPMNIIILGLSTQTTFNLIFSGDIVTKSLNGKKMVYDTNGINIREYDSLPISIDSGYLYEISKEDRRNEKRHFFFLFIDGAGNIYRIGITISSVKNDSGKVINYIVKTKHPIKSHRHRLIEIAYGRIWKEH